ncbi:MAG: radical SAM protein [Leptospiraceae bacterium]|nr:radical SAM protein [Leptospiraceae bacterium]MCK6381093.1 radical SAM protein [Leptospiraceae bacterium]
MIELQIRNEPTEEDRLIFDPYHVFLAGLKNHHISNTAYPISHNVTWREYRVSKETYASYIQSALNRIEEISLYVHIPFCEKKCFYCEYAIVKEKENSLTESYVDYLLKEIDLYDRITDWSSKNISGIDIGGGTPSILNNKLMEKILQKIRNIFPNSQNTKISIETTPKIASHSPEKLKFYQDIGIERISMGIQITDSLLLKKFNREENGEDVFFRATENIRNAGFKKLNIDLMYGFADQSVNSWHETLLKTISLNPDYITLYRMRYKLTKIFKQADRVRLIDVMRHSSLARKILESNGYYSPYGKNTYTKDFNEEGTSEYLTNRVVRGVPYLGFGLGAQSSLDSSVSYNCGASSKQTAPYKSAIDSDKFPIQDLYHLPVSQRIGKFVSVSFYFGGIHLDSFIKKFGFPFDSYFKNEVEFVKHRGLMYETNGWLRSTKKGENFVNGVIALFYAGSIKNLLLQKAKQSTPE